MQRTKYETTSRNPSAIVVQVLKIKGRGKPPSHKPLGFAFAEDVYTLEEYRTAQWEISCYYRMLYPEAECSRASMYLRPETIDELITEFRRNNRAVREENGAMPRMNVDISEIPVRKWKKKK